MSEGHPEPAASFKVARVVVVLLPLAAIVMGAFVYLTMYGGIEQISSWSAPPVVPANGVVMWNNQPVAGAQVQTTFENSKYRGALGVTDAQGHFELMTDVDGKMVSGAYAGKHKVLIAGHRPAQGPAPPTLITPVEYSSFASTPLEITIARDSTSDDLLALTLVGNAPPEPAGPPGGGARPGGPGGPGPSGEEAADAAAAENVDEPAENAAPGSERDPASDESAEAASAEDQP